MGTMIISVVFMLVFWGGLVFFLGEAIILSFVKGQELLLRRMSVFDHHEYYRRSFFEKIGSIFIYSNLRMKIILCALVCVYIVLSALVSVTDSAVSILEQLQAFSVPYT